ncbi:T9SS type A sorting domain-containing protein [Vicingaceae bacterium]|nr:T9SS type A sorting domain-containing protein [Vicingaceae bacterium]
MLRIYLLFYVLILLSFNVSSQSDNCDDNVGSQIIVGNSCNFFQWDSNNGSDYWNTAAGCSATDRDDAWGWFIATSTSTTITYSPDNRDAILHLFQVDAGNCLTNITSIACANDFGNGGDETIIYPTIIGLVYRIRVERLNSNNSMNGDICVFNTPPDGNDCLNPTRVNCGDILLGETTSGFVNTESDWGCSNLPANSTLGEDHFYVIEWPDANLGGIIRLTFSNTSDDDNPFLEIYGLGNSCNPNGCVEEYQLNTGDDDFVTFGVPGGIDDYYFVIDCQTGDYDSFDIEFTCYSGGISLDNVNSCSSIPNTAPINQGYYQTWNGISPPDTASAPLLSQSGYQTICENIYIQNELSYEWLKYFTVTLGSCWTNPTNLTPNGDNTQQNSGTDTGDWDANIIPGNPTILNWEFTHDFFSGWGDGNGGFYSCFLYTFCYDVEVDSNCIEPNGFQNEVNAIDDGIGVGGQNIGASTVTINNTSETALPVDLIFFDVKAIENEGQCEVLLNWKTASEINNDYFTIERSSNGYDFSQIMSISGAFNSNELNNYIVIDEFPSSGINYYRLKQTDLNGAFDYFDIKTVSCENAKNYRVYPNPFTANLKLELPNSSINKYNIEILDSFGRVIYTEKVESNNTILELYNLPSGPYILKAFNDELQIIERIVKIK